MSFSPPSHVFGPATSAAAVHADLEHAREARGVDAAINTTYALSLAEGFRLAAGFVRGLEPGLSPDAVAEALDLRAAQIRQEYRDVASAEVGAGMDHWPVDPDEDLD